MNDFSPSSFRDERGAIRYLEALRQHWRLILGIVVLAVGSAAAVSLTAEKRYEARADLIVQPLDSGDDTFRGMSLFRQPVDGSSTVVALRVLGSAETYSRAYERLGSGATGVSIDLAPLSQGTIVSIQATAPDAQRAALAANTFAETAIELRNEVFQQELNAAIGHLTSLADAIPEAQRPGNFQYASLQQRLAELRAFVGSPDPTVKLLTPAVPPAEAAWPRPVLTIGVALLAALLLGAGAAVGLEVFSARVSREDELTLGHRLPVLARIPRVPPRVATEYLSARRAVLPGTMWRGYRTLRAVLANAGSTGGYPRSLLVTGATPGDGKTMTAVNLAITLASANLRVVLVDCDFHRPMVASVFRATRNRDGVLRALSGAARPDEVLVELEEFPHLRLLLATQAHGSTLNLLDPVRFRTLLAALEEEADVVVVDSPPLPEVVEALSIAEAVETVVVAVRLGHTRREKLNQLRELLARRGISPVGFVVTMRGKTEADSEYYYDGAGDIAPPRQEPRRREPPAARVLRNLEG